MTGIFASGSEARLGSLGIEPLLSNPPLPNIIAEWAAILPLACHLASSRDDYLTTGDIALLGRLSIGLFPRLGTLSGLARLLDRGTKYLDHASTKGGSSRIVWDVKWGSVFPCANGAACTAISRCLKNLDTTPPQRMPETKSPQLRKTDSEKPSLKKSSTIKSRVTFRDADLKERHAKKDDIRRYQLLHVYQLYQKPKKHSLKQSIDELCASTPGKIIWFILLICLTVFLCLLGNYGSATLIVCTSVSELVALNVIIRRPAGYLRNNEAHDACMLVASHENATEWHLYIGQRAIVDTLLNKPMFVVPDGKTAQFASRWFWFANILQFAAMTFVAAQKGWDGIWMVVLLGIHWGLRWSPFGGTLAHDWIEREGVGAEVKSFEFGGRFAMMGAIQLFSGSTATAWMANILVPHPRREAWLTRLRGEEPTEQLNEHDSKWLEYISEASFASAEVLTTEFDVSNTKYQASV
ncbi:hypothetical protein F5B19DRAFT_460222 [Rostrohypoxylon terebratum]|nr:hypothetical protein F5B19DRAFT_460222 [Rostrohypoxylon terebratum]